jgi:DNA-binding response OmpR family regulator
MRVLVVEDEPLIAEVVARALEREGLTVAEVWARRKLEKRTTVL